MHDPDKYRAMSAPFENQTEANAAVKAFYDEVQAAREKHQIGDVICLVEIAHGSKFGERRGTTSLYLGDRAHHLPMMARAYGQERERHETMLGEHIESGRAQVRREFEPE